MNRIPTSDEYDMPPIKYTPNHCYRYDYNLAGIDPEVPLAFPQDEYEDQCRLDEMYFIQLVGRIRVNPPIEVPMFLVMMNPYPQRYQ